MVRHWIFPLKTKIREDKSDLVIEKVNDFLSQWKSHGVPVSGLYRIFFGQIILVYVVDPLGLPSGCSIDSLRTALSEIFAQLDLEILDGNLVMVKINNEFKGIERSDLKASFEQGEISEKSIIFDISADFNPDLDGDQFLKQVKHSWAIHYLT